MPHTVKVLNFHPKPYGRFAEHDSDANGQLFRTRWILPALEAHDEVEIDFTGISVVGASFLDEAIAGLIYHEGFTESELKRRLTVSIPHDPSREATAWRYVKQAEDTVRPKGLPQLVQPAAN